MICALINFKLNLPLCLVVKKLLNLIIKEIDVWELIYISAKRIQYVVDVWLESGFRRVGGVEEAFVMSNMTQKQDILVMFVFVLFYLSL